MKSPKGQKFCVNIFRERTFCQRWAKCEWNLALHEGSLVFGEIMNTNFS